MTKIDIPLNQQSMSEKICNLIKLTCMLLVIQTTIDREQSTVVLG